MALRCSQFTLLLFLIFDIVPRTHGDECPRHRKPWHLLSEEEQMQFVLGFQKLRRSGLLLAFTETHHLEGQSFEDIHKTSEFFFWHSYFVWEMENQFRSLGDNYTCFAMPYWDVTHDAKYLSSSPSSDASSIPILQSVLGGNGNIESNHCVEDDLWNVNRYSTEYLCASSEQSPHCCLKRQVDIDHGSLPSVNEWTDSMRLKRFRDFQDAVSDFHGRIHKFFARTEESHMFSNNAAEDPLFVLVHSWLDYIRSLRSNCWQYDFADAVEENMPFSFDSYLVEDDEGNVEDTNPSLKPRLDTLLAFESICDLEGAVCGETEVTIRSMYDIGSDSRWKVTYEPGPFWNENDELQVFCGSDTLNPQWFYEKMAMVQEEELVGGMEVVGERQMFLRHYFNFWLFNCAAIAGTVSVIWLLVRRYIPDWFRENREWKLSQQREKLLDEELVNEQDHNYGTV